MKALRTGHGFGGLDCLFLSLLDVAGPDIIEHIQVKRIKGSEHLNFIISDVAVEITVEPMGRVYDIGTTDAQEGIHIPLQQIVLFTGEEHDRVEDSGDFPTVNNGSNAIDERLKGRRHNVYALLFSCL